MSDNLNRYGQRDNLIATEPARTQSCPECGHPIGDMLGSRDAICQNCGYEDPCCE